MDPRCEEGLSMKTLHSDISSACRRADSLLWDAYVRSDEKSQTGISGEGRLVFPRYRDGRLRVSEQEARFAFVEALCQGPFRYSVETPTDKLYQFTGNTPLSAQTDLAVHDASGRRRICNVEFKEGRISKSRISSIYKDVEKLLRERRWGLWFHLLEDVDLSDTISNFLEVIVKQIDEVPRRSKDKDVDAPGLTLHVCVLEPSFSLQKDVLLSPNDISNDIKLLKQHLSVCLNKSQPELTKEEDLNGWKLYGKSQV